MSDANDEVIDNADDLELPDALLDLSDDELSGMTFDQVTAKAGVPANAAATTDDNQDDAEAQAEAQRLADEKAAQAAKAAEAEDDALDEQGNPKGKAASDAEAVAAGKAPAAAPAADAEAAAKADEADKTKTEPAAETAEQKLARLYAPFKANGREMQVNDVDEAISLMQMGANYTKKMAALKPNLKLLKLLENNGLLDENKLSFLIDLDKKSPEAIKQLVKDSGIDPLDLEGEKVGAYKPNTYTVDERELALDAVLDDIQGTPTYARTIDLVSNKWDAPSKQVIADNPQLLKVLNDHMASGHFDLISKEIDRERTFGRLAGLSDIEAYRNVGDALAAAGKFNHLVSAPVKTNPSPQQEVTPKAKADDPALKDKKRAASATQAAPAKAGADAELNPLSLSDAEFEKFAASKFR